MLKKAIATVIATVLLLGATTAIAHAKTSSWDSTQRTSSWG